MSLYEEDDERYYNEENKIHLLFQCLNLGLPLDAARRSVFYRFKKKYPTPSRHERKSYIRPTYTIANTLFVGDVFKIPYIDNFEKYIVEIETLNTVALRCKLIDASYNDEWRSWRKDVFIFASYFTASYDDIDETRKEATIDGRNWLSRSLRELKGSRNKLFMLCETYGGYEYMLEQKEMVIPKQGTAKRVHHFISTRKTKERDELKHELIRHDIDYRAYFLKAGWDEIEDLDLDE